MTTNTFREPPVAGDEADVLLGILDRTRRVLAWKCGGVDAGGMRATVGASSVTLGGLLKHLALIEDYCAAQRPRRPDPRVHRRTGGGGPAGARGMRSEPATDIIRVCAIG